MTCRNSENRPTADSHRRVAVAILTCEGSLRAQANHRCSKEREVGGAEGHPRYPCPDVACAVQIGSFLPADAWFATIEIARASRSKSRDRLPRSRISTASIYERIRLTRSPLSGISRMVPIVLLNNEQRALQVIAQSVGDCHVNKLANILEDCRLLQNNRINGYPFRDPWSGPSWTLFVSACNVRTSGMKDMIGCRCVNKASCFSTE